MREMIANHFTALTDYILFVTFVCFIFLQEMFYLFEQCLCAHVTL